MAESSVCDDIIRAELKKRMNTNTSLILLLADAVRL